MWVSMRVDQRPHTQFMLCYKKLKRLTNLIKLMNTVRCGASLLNLFVMYFDITVVVQAMVDLDSFNNCNNYHI